MAKKNEKITFEVKKTTEPKPNSLKLFSSINQNPRYRNANADFLLKKFRLEFDRITTVRPYCNGRLVKPTIPVELEKCRKFKLKLHEKRRRKRGDLYLSKISYGYLLMFSLKIHYCQHQYKR